MSREVPATETLKKYYWLLVTSVREVAGQQCGQSDVVEGSYSALADLSQFFQLQVLMSTPYPQASAFVYMGHTNA